MSKDIPVLLTKALLMGGSTGMGQPRITPMPKQLNSTQLYAKYLSHQAKGTSEAINTRRDPSLGNSARLHKALPGLPLNKAYVMQDPPVVFDEFISPRNRQFRRDRRDANRQIKDAVNGTKTPEPPSKKRWPKNTYSSEERKSFVPKGDAYARGKLFDSTNEDKETKIPNARVQNTEPPHLKPDQTKVVYKPALKHDVSDFKTYGKGRSQN